MSTTGRGCSRPTTILTRQRAKQITVRRPAPITDADGTILHSGASNAEVNRELAILKRAFSLAIKDGLLSAKPYIPMLTENNVRQGFLEREQYDAVPAARAGAVAAGDDVRVPDRLARAE